AEVDANWEAIKAEERGGASALASVPLAAPALTLAATLQRKAARAGLPDEVVAPERAAAGSSAAAVTASVASVADQPSVEAAGRLLWTVVVMLRELDIDPETALRS